MMFGSTSYCQNQLYFYKNKVSEGKRIDVNIKFKIHAKALRGIMASQADWRIAVFRGFIFVK